MHSTSLFLSIITFLGAVAASQMASVSFTPAALATGAGSVSPVLSPSFAGMGIEPSNLFSFTGFEATNQLSVNCLTNLANYTGVPPYLRIGGNTQDYMIWQDNYTEYSLAPNPSPVGIGAFASDSLFFGPRYFEAINRFPPGSPITFGLNLAYDKTAYGGYLDLIVAEAEAARTMLTNVHLQAFEIGNEPDLWLQNGFRVGEWSGAIYGQEWAERAEAVWQQVLQPNDLPSNFFEPGTTASTIGTSFEIEMLASSDITGPAPGSNAGYVNAWSQHDYYYYIGVSTYALTLVQMMDLRTTATQFESWVDQVNQAKATNIPYVLREMASVGPVGQVGISDTFGATLFTFNFFLYTAGLGISSVEFHMTDTSYASPWQPIQMDIFTTGPHVRSSYCAWAAMAQLIGPSCNTRLVGLPINTYPSGYDGNLAAYTTYNAGKLASLVMINSKQSNATVVNKASAEFTFNIPDAAGEVFYLSYLTAPGADSTTGTTWNGYSYEMSGDGSPTVVNTKVDSIRVPSNGTFTVRVRDSQAIVANRGLVLGSAASVSNTNCVNLAREAAAIQGENQQQRHPITVHSAPDAANPTGANNYNANGAASGAGSGIGGSSGSSSGSDSTQNAAFAAVASPSVARVALLGALIGGIAMFA